MAVVIGRRSLFIGHWGEAAHCPLLPLPRSALRIPHSALILLLALTAPAVRADFFLRLGPGRQALEQLGGAPLHAADVKINGQPGRMAVYGFDAAPETLAPDLRKALALPGLPNGAALVTRVADGRAASLLLLPGDAPRRSVAILIEQTAEARRLAASAPPAWPAGLACPGAELLFSAENEKTRTALAVAATADAPEAAAARMGGVLAGAGWVRVPLAGTPGFAIHTRGNRVCVVSAAAGADRRTRITVLQRLGTAP